MLLAVGAVTGLAGIAFAIGQHDLKRLLAYSSIENIGIIAMGLGLALLGGSQGRADWVVLGLGGALLHVWNHACSSRCCSSTPGRSSTPRTPARWTAWAGWPNGCRGRRRLFVVGAVAICALPPLNGFASEWLLYLGLFRTSSSGGTAALAAAAIAAVGLAMIGALAVACFVKLFGTVFLGIAAERRREARPRPARQHASCPWPSWPWAAWALGLLPMFAAPLLGTGGCRLDCPARRAVPLLADARAAEVALRRWRWACCGLRAWRSSLIWTVLSRLDDRSARRAPGTAATPGRRPACSTPARPSCRCWSACSRSCSGPARHEPAIAGHLPRKTRFKSVMPDTVLDRLVRPVFRLAGQYLPRLRVFQQGQTQFYVLYILVTVIVLLVWGAMGAQP